MWHHLLAQAEDPLWRSFHAHIWHSGTLLASFSLSLTTSNFHTSLGLSQHGSVRADTILMKLLTSKEETYETSRIAQGYAQNRHSITFPISISQSSNRSSLDSSLKRNGQATLQRSIRSGRQYGHHLLQRQHCLTVKQSPESRAVGHMRNQNNKEGSSD